MVGKHLSCSCIVCVWVHTLNRWHQRRARNSHTRQCQGHRHGRGFSSVSSHRRTHHRLRTHIEHCCCLTYMQTERQTYRASYCPSTEVNSVNMYKYCSDCKQLSPYNSMKTLLHNHACARTLSGRHKHSMKLTIGWAAKACCCEDRHFWPACLCWTTDLRLNTDAVKCARFKALYQHVGCRVRCIFHINGLTSQWTVWKGILLITEKLTTFQNFCRFIATCILRPAFFINVTYM